MSTRASRSSSQTRNVETRSQLIMRTINIRNALLTKMEEPSVKKLKTEPERDYVEPSCQFPYDQLYTCKYSLPRSAGESINAVKVSNNQSKLATCSSLGSIQIYDFVSGSLIATLKGHTKGVSDIAFSPINSDILASGSDDLTIRLWSISQKRCIRILKKHTYHITTVVFNSKGSMLISGAADETIVLWDLTSGKSLKTLAAHSDPVSSVCLTPDDTVIVSASYDGLMRLFDTETGQCLKTLIYNSTSHGTATASTSDVVNFPISKVTVSPNGKYILSSSLDGKIRLWDYMSNKVVKTYLGVGGSTPINNKYNSGSAFVQKTKKAIVVSGSDSCGTLFWDLQTKAIVYQLMSGSTILDVVAIDGGAYLATSSLTGEVHVLELNKQYYAEESGVAIINGKSTNLRNGNFVDNDLRDNPEGTPTETPTETPAETPTETPTETPIDTPGDTPIDTTQEAPSKLTSDTSNGMS